MNADERMRQHERISALADGQLSGVEFAATVELTALDGDARATWHLYHLVGEVLRSGESGTLARDRDFLTRLNARLEAEPDARRDLKGNQNIPELIAVEDRQTLEKGQHFQKTAAAANDGIFRWKLLAGCASLAAVAAISWSAVGLFNKAPDGALLARSGTSPAGQGGPLLLAGAEETLPGAPIMIRDRELDALLAAHRQSGGSSALQNPSGFLRNATFAGVAR
jgi:sigma-E factor negative regulatory protein RseA